MTVDQAVLLNNEFSAKLDTETLSALYRASYNETFVDDLRTLLMEILWSEIIDQLTETP